MDERGQDEEVRLQGETNVLGNPTRNRLFRYMAHPPGPVGVAELTDYAGLNHNAVRSHLAVLKDCGVVVEELEKPDRIGRPRLLYRLHPEATGLWGRSGLYPGWPSCSVKRCGTRRTRVRSDGGRVECVLGRCPFAEVTSDEPETVCRLRPGLAEGLADVVDDLDLERLVPKKASRASCRLVLRRKAGRTKASA